MVGYLQDIYPDVAVALGKVPNNWMVRQLRKSLFSIYRSCDRMVVLSEDMKRLLISGGVESDRIDIVPNWSDPTTVRPLENNSFRVKHGFESKFLVMYSGNLGLTQRLEEFVAAADLLSDLPQVVFAFVGQGSQRQTLLDLVRTKKLVNVQFDWDERSKVIKLDVDQDKARLLGTSSQEVSAFINSSLNGTQATFFRERDKQIEVLIRGAADERAKLHLLESLNIPTRSGRAVPLTQIATVRYEFEDGVIWRRDRLPTIIVRGDIYDSSVQPATVAGEITPLLVPIKATLPVGYRLDVAGAVEESAKGQASINAGVPLFLFVVVTALMIQLMSFQRVFLVLLTAPLGLIGVAPFLLLFNKPFGFVAMLGTIALFGMIMRNSVILIDQIEKDISAGHDPFNSVIDATVRRLRPIALTALAAILAMIPLTRSDFFGPMAVAIMGGLFVGTLLTLLFLPALYAAWFRVKPATQSALPVQRSSS